ncbi:MAG: FecR family protein, partial [Rikenellaceae bacterium]
EINKTIFRPTLILEDGENVDLTSRNIILNDTIVKKSGQNKLIYDRTSITKELKYNTLIIPKLFTYTVELSDGTTICLNANSELKYPIQFNQDKREVYLKGEGYFNVKKGEKPFIIHTGDMKVQVYGTQFNINAYNKSSIKTVLIQGSVGVTVKDGDPVMMKPNQMVEVTSNGETIISDVDLTQYITWLDGDITSTNSPLTDLLDKISAWYGIEFNCTIDLKGINVTTSLSNKLSLEKILNGISETTNLKIIKNGENQYVIK